MKKIFYLFISMLLLTGCGKVDKDNLVKDFKDKVESSKSYVTDSVMEIYNAEDTFTYNIKVSYMDDDYFKVNMLNKMNNHEQIILRNGDEVYVVTPSLNKSYKFESEWPYNSSQSYILSTLVKDIDESSEVNFTEEEDGYAIKVDVNYPNNTNLTYEKLYFDKNKNLNRVDVYDSNDIVTISVKYNKIDYKANLKNDDFDFNKLVGDNCCGDDSKEEDNSNTDKDNTGSKDNVDKDNTDSKNGTSNDQTGEKNSSGDKKNTGSNTSTGNNAQTSSLEDIVYPLYIPANTYLKNKELVDTENGERAILTFNGEKNFILIEESSKKNDEFELISVYGDPTMLNNTIGALSNNALSWTIDNVDYYLASNDLSTTELLTIADSLTDEALVVEK